MTTWPAGGSRPDTVRRPDRAGRFPHLPGRGAALWVAGAVFIAILALVTVRQTGLLDRHFIYFPERDIPATPAEHGLRYEDVHIEASDGVRLHGWLVPPPKPVGSNPRVLIWLHGNSGNIGHRAAAVAAMARGIGTTVLIIDYRGYGRSEGSPGEEGLYRDAEAAFDYVEALPEFAGASIIAFGRSLGAAVAAQLAMRRAVDALVLESPFTSVSEMARIKSGLLPARLLVRARFDTIQKMPSIRVPVLVMHGTADEIVPFEMGRRVYEAAAGPRRMHAMDGATHNQPHNDPGGRYYEVLGEFIAEWTGGG